MREVSVLSVDRDLRDAVPPAERPLAERAIRAACVRLPQGPWEPTEPAIMSLPRSEDRILALFWHLAERWGTVHPDGVKVRLKLTHELIGRLTGSKRPTVSLALAQLAEEGLLRFEGGVGWRLDHGSAAALRDGSYRSPTEDASSRPAASLLA